MPDVLILSSDYLALYARQGLLWDMTNAWNNSATKASGRLVADAEKIMEANYVKGVDGEKALYGFVPARGNGCCTYVKEAWATAAGYTKADLQKQMTYDEYYTMLKKMKEAKGVDYVISAPGFYSKEVPYTNYLPEFYQNAQFTFYYDKAQGKYVDGFSEQEMKRMLFRESRTLLRMDLSIRNQVQRQHLHHVTTSSHQILRQNQVYLHTGLEHGLIS